MMGEIADSGWVMADPPPIDADDSVIAVVNGEEIRMGFEKEESPIKETDDMTHRRFRTGPYDLDVKIEGFASGSIMGQVKVERADGYDQNV